jgi:hypothetical protein
LLLVATVEIFLRLLDLSENQNGASRNAVSALWVEILKSRVESRVYDEPCGKAKCPEREKKQ